MEISSSQIGLSGVLGDWNIDTEMLVENYKGKVNRLLGKVVEHFEKENVLHSILKKGFDLTDNEKSKLKECYADGIINISDIVGVFRNRMDSFLDGTFEKKLLNDSEKSIYKHYTGITTGNNPIEDLTEKECNMFKYESLKDYIKSILNKI